MKQLFLAAVAQGMGPYDLQVFFDVAILRLRPFGLQEVWENTALTDLCGLIQCGKYWPYLPGFLEIFGF